MNSVRIDRSNPDVVDVVLGEDIGPRAYAARRWPKEVLESLATGALYGIPVYLVMGMAFDQGAGRIWATVGLAAAVGLLVNTFAIFYRGVRNVTRLRFSPAASPTAMTVVRGPRTDPPIRLIGLRQIWIDHSVTESATAGRKPVSVKINLKVLLWNGRTVRPVPLLPPTTDTAALHRQLQQTLAPTDVQVDLVVKRRVESRGSGAGYGGSTGGVGGGGG
ncbi:hypothetical protein ACWENO_29885 [Streptomyces sp. NPDC004436]